MLREALEIAQEAYQSSYNAGAVDGLDDVEQIAIEAFLAKKMQQMATATAEDIDRIYRELQPLADALADVSSYGDRAISSLRQLARQYLTIREIKLKVLARISMRGSHLHSIGLELKRRNVSLVGSDLDLQGWVTRTSEAFNKSFRYDDQVIDGMLSQWRKHWQTIYRKYRGLPDMPPLPPVRNS